MIKSLFGNPLTTLGGVLMAVGVYLAGQPGAWGVVGQVLLGIGGLLTGGAAQDARTKTGGGL